MGPSSDGRRAEAWASLLLVAACSAGAPPVPATAQGPSLGTETAAVRVEALDERARPLARHAVRLWTGRDARGYTRWTEVGGAQTDDRGIASFDRLAKGRYRASVASGEATFSSDPFELVRSSDQVVRVGALPFTSELGQTRVGMRTFVYLEPIDHWIHVQVMTRVLNIGDNAWVPRDATAGIPPGASDFESETGSPDPELEL